MLIVLTTTPSQVEAKKIARTLVEEKRAACVNILPSIHSIYWWEGKICEDEEWLLLIKTDTFEKVAKRIEELHSYEVPEIVSVKIEDVAQKYGEWLNGVLVQ